MVKDQPSSHRFGNRSPSKYSNSFDMAGLREEVKPLKTFNPVSAVSHTFDQNSNISGLCMYITTDIDDSARAKSEQLL